MTQIFLGIVAGAIGLAYITYGKRQARFAALISGVLLCAVPYFIDSVVWLCVVAALLMAAPFVIDF